MAERTSNVLLKALEEPPERTVWVLCAPSEADLLPTIRSRVRIGAAAGARASPTSPPCSSVATASTPNSPSRPHARRRATSAWRSGSPPTPRRAPAATRRSSSRCVSASARDAVSTAARLRRGRRRRREGAHRAATTPRARARAALARHRPRAAPCRPPLRSQLKALEDDQKRRATRSLRDGIDRILVDLRRCTATSCCCSSAPTCELINREMLDRTAARPRQPPTPARTLATLDRDRETGTNPHREQRRTRPRARGDARLRDPHDRTTRGRMSAPHTTPRSRHAGVVCRSLAGRGRGSSCALSGCLYR